MRTMAAAKVGNTHGMAIATGPQRPQSCASLPLNRCLRVASTMWRASPMVIQIDPVRRPIVPAIVHPITAGVAPWSNHRRTAIPNTMKDTTVSPMAA